MNFVGYITVRLNSKRVFHKSIRVLGNKPLINYSIDTLNKVPIRDIILYSHNNLSRYIDTNLRYRWVKRPEIFDGDATTFNDILDSIVDSLDTDYIVFLTCTSPFIKSETIIDMIDKVNSGEYDSAFTTSRNQTFAWYDGNPLNYDPSNVPRTQDIKPVFLETSGLYIFSKKLFRETHRRIGFNPYIKEVDLFEGWDIDTEFDFGVAQIFWHYRNKK
jgi:CMP-N-acetylneuraminic acid synthetase